MNTTKNFETFHTALHSPLRVISRWDDAAFYSPIAAQIFSISSQFLEILLLSCQFPACAHLFFSLQTISSIHLCSRLQFSLLFSRRAKLEEASPNISALKLASLLLLQARFSFFLTTVIAASNTPTTATNARKRIPNPTNYLNSNARAAHHDSPRAPWGNNFSRRPCSCGVMVMVRSGFGKKPVPLSGHSIRHSASSSK